jgi:hypothetical protein
MKVNLPYTTPQGANILFKRSTTILAVTGSPSSHQQQPRSGCRIPWSEQLFSKAHAFPPRIRKTIQRVFSFTPRVQRAIQRVLSFLPRAIRATPRVCQLRPKKKSLPTRIHITNTWHLRPIQLRKRQNRRNHLHLLGNGIALPRSGTPASGI